MKDILKTGKVAVWTIGEQCLIQAAEGATDWDLLQAMDAEDELQMYREGAQWN